jgi:hypothetical protein
VRIGWTLPPITPQLVTLHGPLMVGGFLGVVVSLERAVAINRGWAYAAPGLAALGSLSALVGLPVSLAAGLLVGASALLVLIFERIYRLRPEWSTVLLMLGGLAWLVGNALWLGGQPVPLVVPWWAGFIVLTIVGERMELAQVLLPARSRAWLLLAAAVLLIGLVVATVTFGPGVQVGGLGLLGLSAWLLRYDIARRTLGRPGLPRFGGVALVLGYLWLALTGLVWVLGPDRLASGFWYDAMLHGVFLGFAFSMIFAHAPTILPAITGVQVPFRPRFYAHLGLLHASLVLRIAGDLLGVQEARRWGGLLNVVAVLVFVGLSAQAAHSWRSLANHGQ